MRPNANGALPAECPLVHVVLLNWHGWRDTLACLESLSRLDYPRWVPIVVDNGSTDDSVARIRAAAPATRLLESPCNLGFSGGCNVGIRWALEHGADYVWLLNNDTTVEPSCLRHMVTVAQGDPCLGAVGSVVREMAHPERVQSWGGGRLNLFFGYQRPCTSRPPNGEPDFLTGASLLLRREALLELGGLDPGYFMYWEDADCCLSLRARGWSLRVAEDAVVLHKDSASLEHASPTRIRYFSASAVRFFRRHSPVPLLPIAVGLAGRIAKRIPDWRRWPEIAASLEGARAGWRRERSPSGSATTSSGRLPPQGPPR